MLDTTARLKAALTGRYTLERELGRGGMATVWLAQDLKHDRPVALKVLRPELAAALGPERFLREVRITARLNHPHILPLLDSGEADGFLFYVMPYVAGESLRDRLDREKQLPLDDALQIAREVADALSYAHGHDVVHRDVKPENILLESGHAVVADFGVARAITAAGGERLTETGIAVGTPAYMSPEQAAGSKDVDGRSDTYSLGCVLYEMLAGRPPFVGPTAESVVHQHLTVEPHPITGLRPAVPAAVAGALSRALARTPADRFNPVALFAEAIAPQASASVVVTPPAPVARTGRTWPRPAVLGMALVVLIAGAASLGRWLRPGESGSSRPRTAIAVLSFQNLSNDAHLSPDTTDAYLVDGLTVELIDRLGAIERLRVQPRSVVQRYRDRDAGPAELGKAMGVTYLVDGTVRRAGSRIRVTVELIRAATGERMWGRSYDRSATDLLDIETSIALALAREIAGQLVPEERARLAAQPTTNPQAYEHFLRGNYELARRTERSFRLALKEYQAALEADPAFGAALARMAYAYALSLDYDAFPDQPAESVIVRGLTMADRALALDSGLSDGWLARAHILRYVYPDTYQGIREAGVREALRRAINLNPRNAEAYHRLGEVVRSFGEDSLAVTFFDSALALDPYRPITLLSIAEVRWTQRRFEEAMRWMDSVAVVDPGFVFNPYRAHLALHLDDTLAARGYGEAALHADSLNAYAQSATAILELRRGHKAAARALLDRALARFAQDDTVHVDDAHAMAIGLLAVGDVDRAVAVLSRTRPGIYLRYMLRWPEFDSIRSDPRFERLAGPIRRPG